MKRTAISLLGSLVLTLGWLLAADSWETKPYSEWTEKEINKILTASPWGAQKSVGDTMMSSAPPGMSGGSGRRGGGSTGGPDLSRSTAVSVRLHSSLPVRAALARKAQLAGSYTEEQAAEFVQTHPAPGYLVVGLTVPGGRNRVSYADDEIESLKQKIYIELNKTKKRINFERLVPPVRGRGPEAYLYFPRMEGDVDLFLEESEGFKFAADLDSRTKIRINYKFKKMMFQGKLEV